MAAPEAVGCPHHAVPYILLAVFVQRLRSQEHVKHGRCTQRKHGVRTAGRVGRQVGSDSCP